MGGSSPNPDLPFFGNFVYFCVVLFAVYVSKKKLKKEKDREVGGWSLVNPSFSRIFLFFST